jgi:hypothetical protein
VVAKVLEIGSGGGGSYPIAQHAVGRSERTKDATLLLAIKLLAFDSEILLALPLFVDSDINSVRSALSPRIPNILKYTKFSAKSNILLPKYIEL